MKHPCPTVEPFEFNIGQAPQLRCGSTGKATVCGNCETCCLIRKIKHVEGWFQRVGTQSKRRLVLGLVRRFHSLDLLHYITQLLQPLLGKDFTYARARTKPSLQTDRATMSADRALNANEIERELSSTWDWFQSSNYWTKSNFILTLLQWCEAHLLYIVGTQAKTLLASERRANIQIDQLTEAASIPSTHYSYESLNHPELELLTRSRSEYSVISRSPFKDKTDDSSSCPSRVSSQLSINENAEVIENADSGDETFTDDDDISLRSLAHAHFINPTSSQAYAGVARHKDFIRCLPVHLSKAILGLLDQVALWNCLCVSRNWRVLVEEVHKETYVNQQLWEEVMLMQGAGAQGVNPVYAKDIDIAVPNTAPGGWQVLHTAEDRASTTFRSEVNFQTAYTGVATRNVIMEERNVFCGAYNVLVLSDQSDDNRVIHTDGGPWLAVGSDDRRVRFLHRDSGKVVGPLVTGHAGSVLCVHINQEEGYLLSGSFDTSVRKWSLETGKCLKIFRGKGHHDSVTCLDVHKNLMASGSKDRKCIVWNMESGKSFRIFRHRRAISAVAVGEERCITGCERGKVKVWDMKTGQLIKCLKGHQGFVTSIKFDRWHIVTGSKDGYALAWSAIGNHARCLSALRHPKEVLCLELMYLRVVTGSEDGKIRIWNIVRGQCCRIMRGNSRSDPVLSLLAIADRMFINTKNTVLVLNFESVDWDYSLPSDKVPPLVQYGKYSDAPVRQQPYAYIRAQRMQTAGATNTKILKHDTSTVSSGRFSNKPEQTLHSAKSLSRKSLQSAKAIQLLGYSSSHADTGYESQEERPLESRMTYATAAGSGRKTTSCVSNTNKLSASPSAKTTTTLGWCSKPVSSASSKPGVSWNGKTTSTSGVSTKPPSSPGKQYSTSSRPNTAASKASKPTVSISLGPAESVKDTESATMQNRSVSLGRRISWAYEHPTIPKTKNMQLQETKSLLRSQMRMKKEDVVPPDFVYLTVNALQKSMKEPPPNIAHLPPSKEFDPYSSKRLSRPNSGPARIDPRTKVPVEDLELGGLMHMPQAGDAMSDTESKVSHVICKASSHSSSKPRVPVPTTQTFTTGFKSTSISTTARDSSYPKSVKSSIPQGRVLRPRSALVHRSASNPELQPRVEGKNRPKSAAAAAHRRPTTASSIKTACSSTPSTGSSLYRKKHGFSTSSTELAMVPMLMYPQDMAHKIANVKAKKTTTVSMVEQASGEPAAWGKVSPYNLPMREHCQFRLLTHQQQAQQVETMEKVYIDSKRDDEENIRKKQQRKWLSKVTGSKNGKDNANGMKSAAK